MDHAKKVFVGIPARMSSTRFPGKPLEKILDKTMINHVWARAMLNTVTSNVYVMGCDTSVESECASIGAKYKSTSPDINRPGERVYQGLLSIEVSEDDIIIVVQGDEPLLQPSLIDQVVKLMNTDSSIEVVNVIGSINGNEAEDPNEIKVVFNSDQSPIYMSRSKIPSTIHSENQTEFWKQICVFGFTWKSMKKFYEDTLPGKLEAAESIEMLRAIESSFIFKLLKSDVKMCSVDTIDDLKYVETLMKTDSLYLKGY